MLRFFKFLALLGLLSLALCACSASSSAVQDPPAQPALDTELTEVEARAKLQSLDAQIWNGVNAGFEALPLTEKQKSGVENYLNGGSNEPALGEISYDSSKNGLSLTVPVPGVDPAFIIPAAMIAGEKWSSIYTSYSTFNVGAEMSWLQCFHWVNHMGPEIGGSYYKLSSNAAVLSKMWQEGIAGNASIYYLPGGGGMREQYMVVARAVVNGVPSNYPWVSIVAAENGAPVTAFNTSLVHGVEKVTETGRFLAKSASRGWVQIDADDLPEAIKNGWGVKAPSLIRLIYWGVSYQVKMYAAATGVTLAESAVQLSSLAGKVSILSRMFNLPLIIFWDPGMMEPWKPKTTID